MTCAMHRRLCHCPRGRGHFTIEGQVIDTRHDRREWQHMGGSTGTLGHRRTCAACRATPARMCPAPRAQIPHPATAQPPRTPARPRAHRGRITQRRRKRRAWDCTRDRPSRLSFRPVLDRPLPCFPVPVPAHRSCRRCACLPAEARAPMPCSGMRGRALQGSSLHAGWLYTPEHQISSNNSASHAPPRAQPRTARPSARVGTRPAAAPPGRAPCAGRARGARLGRLGGA